MSLNEGDLENSLRTLTRLLCKHHNQEVQTIYKYGETFREIYQAITTKSQRRQIDRYANYD